MDEAIRNKQMDDYLLNRLNEEDKKAFLIQLENDMAMQDELKLREVMIKQVKTIGDLRMKDKILDIQKKVEGKKAKTIRMGMIRNVISAAAVISLLIIGFQWLNSPPSSQSLFAQNYEAYDELRFGSRSDGADKKVIDAGALYQQGKYAEALPLFENLVADGKGDDRITLAIAICQLENKDFEKAIVTLKQASTQSGFLYLDQAQWYLALAHLQLNEMEESKTLLQNITKNPNTFFFKEAQKLLDDFE